MRQAHRGHIRFRLCHVSSAPVQPTASCFPGWSSNLVLIPLHGDRPQLKAEKQLRRTSDFARIDDGGFFLLGCGSFSADYLSQDEKPFQFFFGLLLLSPAHLLPVFCKKLYTFSPAELLSERGEKEVLADSNQPSAPPSTKSHVSYCAARARRREKMAAEGTSSTTGWSLLQSVLVSAVDSCHCPHPSHPSTALLSIAPLSLSLRPGLMHSKMWLCELYIICYQF